MTDPLSYADLPRGEGPVIEADGDIVILDESNALRFTPEEEALWRAWHKKRLEEKYGCPAPTPPPAQP